MSSDASSAGQPASAPGGAGSARDAAALRLPAEVTFANARAVLEQAMAGLDAVQPVLDLSDCRHFDSSLIGVLLELQRRESVAGRRCSFVGASANLRKLSGLYGVEGLLFGNLAEQGTASGRTGP